MRLFIAVMLAAAAVIVFPSAHANADEPYYIELGESATSADAAKTWQDIGLKYKSALKGLQYAPVNVVQLDGSTLTRIQAGPITSKKKAQSICTQLFKRNEPCFVIEGERLPAKTSETAQVSHKFLPWRMQQPVESGDIAVADSNAEKPPIVLPWLKDGLSQSASASAEAAPDADIDSSNNETVATVPAPGKVEVSEAIRVPLTDQENQAMIRPVEPKPQSNLPVPGWLNIESFASDEKASSFWEYVRSTIPNLAAGLRVKLVHPAIHPDNEPDRVTLNVGPFPTRDDALAFCRSGVKAANSALVCHFDEQEPTGMAEALPAAYTHADQYAARRRALASHENVASSQSNAPASDGVPDGKAYWLQVATAPTEMEALQVWEKLRTDNSDILDGVRSSISASLMKGSAYIVRVGPLTDHDQAQKLCKTLQDRSVACRIFTNM